MHARVLVHVFQTGSRLFRFKTIDEVFYQRRFVALPTELQHRLAMLTGIEPATHEVDVLRYGSQLCIGGDEVVFRGWLPSEPAPVFSTRGRDGDRTRMYSKSAVAMFCKSLDEVIAESF